MKKASYAKYYAIPFFFLMMLLDGHITLWIESWLKNQYTANAQLLLLAMLCGARYLPKNFMLLTAIVFGCLYDLYYIGVIGIYAVGIPLMVWLMYILANTLYQNFLTLLFGMIIFLTSLELVTWGIQLLFNLATVDSSFFITRFLGPTLLINIVLFLIFSIPFQKLFKYE